MVVTPDKLIYHENGNSSMYIFSEFPASTSPTWLFSCIIVAFLGVVYPHKMF